MSSSASYRRKGSDPTKETLAMHHRLATLVATLAAVALLLTGLAASSASAASPWWQVVTGSRPTNMWEPTDSVQTIETELGEIGAAIELKVKGKVVGCLGAGLAGELICPGFLELPQTETASQLEAILETAFGTPAVEVSGGPVGGEPFVVTVLGQPAPGIGASPIFVGFGSAKVKVISIGGSGRLNVTLTNLGTSAVDGGASPVKIVDKLPAGMEALEVEGEAGEESEFGPVDCSIESPSEISCDFESKLPPYQSIEVETTVNLTGSPPVAGAPGTVTVSGGGASSAGATQTVNVSPEPTPFGIEYFSARAEEEGGTLSTQAGSHPFQLTTSIQLNSGRMTPGARRKDSIIEQPAQPRNLRFPLPAGLVGNAAAVPQCRMVDFLSFGGDEASNCSPANAVGVASVLISENFPEASVGFVRKTVPIFNLVPAQGEPARFGFSVFTNPVLIDTAVDPADGYRITAKVSNTTQLVAFLSSSVTLWGTPADTGHDSSRGWACFNQGPGSCERPSVLGEAPLLRQPVSCDGPLDFSVDLEPWNVPLGSQIESASSPTEGMHGCNQVPFDPSIAAAATSKLAENPSGFDFQLEMPNFGLLKKEAVAEGQAKKVEVTLPEGMTINPSQAEGLAVCSPGDYQRERFDSAPGAGCPDASKIGEVQISTPLLKEEARGSLFIAKPYDNPFGSLIALYMVAKIPERGVLIKQAGKVVPDPKTGQLVTTFDDLPQLPFSTFKLHFREGGRAPLVTPPTCGEHEVVARFTPWSATDPDNPLPSEIVTRTSSFTTERGVDGGACPAGNPPFRPGFEAGSVNPAAGHYSPFYMRLTRKDGDQDLTKFSSVLPEGALAKLAGVTQCPQAAVEAAKAKQGVDEKASPSCPASSRIGRTSVGAGVGSILTYVPGQLYLGGPYHGSTLSVVSITPAVAGPFDLGTVVVQEGLKLDPATGEVHVDGNASDPIPHILQGVPLKVRDLRVYVDRDQFTTTPTSCDPMATRAALFGSGLDVFSSADDVPTDLSARYQAASCERLGFKPRLKLKLSAKRSTRGANPALRAVLRPRLGDANPDRIQVALPGSELLEQSHIRTICTRVQFAAGAGFGSSCPKGSVYGHVKAWTPLLDEPLEGPVYLRSSNHELPDMVLALGGLVNIESVGRIDSINGRIRSTFENVPDAPLSKVVLSMQGGRKGLLVNSTDICRGVHRAKARFTGQNGKVFAAATKVEAGCKGAKRGKR